MKRLKERNNLTESDAKARIAGLPSNAELVAKAHVVMSTYWSPRYTQKQVEKAWKALQLYLAESVKLWNRFVTQNYIFLSWSFCGLWVISFTIFKNCFMGECCSFNILCSYIPQTCLMLIGWHPCCNQGKSFHSLSLECVVSVQTVTTTGTLPSMCMNCHNWALYYVALLYLLRDWCCRHNTSTKKWKTFYVNRGSSCWVLVVWEP